MPSALNATEPSCDHKAFPGASITPTEEAA